jgi:hypothetical protein
MSEQGDCVEKAGAERCLGRCKGEGTALRPYATRQEARQDVVEDIEMCDNSPR